MGKDRARARVRALGVVAFALGTAVGALVAVPLPWTPVPLTLQPLFVLTAGAVLGPWHGAAALALYLAMGAVGLPVFSGGNGGVEWLMGPTGGYLVVYPAAAFLVGSVGDEGRSLERDAAALLAGLAVLYAGGVAQLWLLSGVEVGQLLALGVRPFLAGDLVKVLLALAALRALRIARPDRS
jgi:biotin transport system substrate-specific component